MSADTPRCLHRATHVWSVAILATIGVVLAAAGALRAQAKPATPAKPTNVLFMCPHGAGKSVLASAYFQQLAKERGLNVRVDAAGLEPDPVVGPAIAEHLTKNGYRVPISKPRAVTPDDLTTADVVISLGCDVTGLPVRRDVLQRWDDVPAPSEDFARADEAIRRHVAELVDELGRRSK